MFKPIDCATAIVNPEANHELCVAMMCQHGFINSTNVPSLMGEFDKGRKLCMCGERDCMINPCICLSILLLILKLALKIKAVFFLKQVLGYFGCRSSVMCHPVC